MSQISLRSPSGGTFSIVPEDVAGITTLTLPANVTGLAGTTNGKIGGALLPAGSILQVVSASTTTGVTITTTTWTDTTLTATITPSSATSKILVMVDQVIEGHRNSSGTIDYGTRLLRGSTVIVNPTGSDTDLYYYNGNISAAADALPRVNLLGNYVTNHLDSPATTSPVTYKTQGSLSAGTRLTFQVQGYDPGKVTRPSTIILMEVAG